MHALVVQDLSLEEMRKRHREANKWKVVCDRYVAHDDKIKERHSTVEGDLSWDAAHQLAGELQRQFTVQNPDTTHWTCDYYSVCLDNHDSATPVL